MTGRDGDGEAEDTRTGGLEASPSPGPTSAAPSPGDRRSVMLPRPSLSRATTSTPSDYHPLSPAGGAPRLHLTRRVSSVTDANQAGASGHFDVQPRRHAASVSTPGMNRTSSGTAASPASASTAHASPSSTSSPAVAALQAVAATHAQASGVLLTPRRADSDLLGLHVGSRRSRRQSADPGEMARTTASLFGDDEEATPRRPQRLPRTSGTPLAGGWAGYLDSLSRDEIEVLDTPFDVMSDAELENALRPYATETRSKSKRGSINGSHGDKSGDKSGGRDSPTKGKQKSSPGTPDTPPTVSTPLFPPSPPGPTATRAEHPLSVLSRAVRELREVISRLEEDNAKLRLRELTAAPTSGMTPSSTARPSFASSGSGLNIMMPNAAPTSNESSPRPMPLPSVAERPRDQLHDFLADALSTSLTSPTHSHLSLMEPRAEYHHDDETQSPTPSTLSFARPKSPAMSTRSVVSLERGRALSGASSSSNLLDQKDGKDKKGWGIFGWAKKPHRKGSVSSLTPSMSGLVPALESVEDEEWRRGDGGSSPSFRAIFLATRILTPDPASILIEPARDNASLAGLAHALVSNARDEDISVRDPPGRARARSRAASISSAKQVIQPSIDVTNNDQSASGPGYGDTALAATVGFGRSILSLSRGKGGVDDHRHKSRPSIAPVRAPRSGYPTSQASPHTPISPGASAADTPPPSVELGTIVPYESRPPTVLLSRQNLGSFFQSSRSKLATATRFESDDPPLTDRYGFIYDIQHANMLKDASRAGTPAPISLTGHIPELRHSDTLEVPPTSRPASTHSTEERSETLRADRSSTATSTSSSSSTTAPSPSQPSSATPEPASPPSTNTQRPRRPTGLAPTPAKPVAAKDDFTVSVRGSSSLGSTASTTAVTGATAKGSASRLTVSSLLDQLTDIHDKQQKARTAEWDAFLRRRTRRKGSSDRRGGVQDVGVSGAIASAVALAGTQSKSGQEEYRLFQRLVRRGIPIPYRADVWAECSGARDLLVPGEYAEILAVHRDDYSPVMAEIEKDVGRTFPGNVFFGGDGPGVAKLRRVLVAYSWHNPAVGYCQGMNMLAATLLLTHTDEEQAFWVLHCMIERLLPADYFAPSLEGSRADQLALGDLVAQHVPRVAVHLAELGVDLTSVTFGWFLSLFTDCLPVETLFRVWDVFFVEGHAVLFRVAIAILKLNETELCATESVTDLFAFIAGMTSRLWGADKLIALQHSYKSAMRDGQIQTLVERYAGELQHSDGESE